MFESASHFPGYLSAQLIPPESVQGEYQLVQRFATERDLARWNASKERATWLTRLRPVAEGEPEYRLLTGLEAWFAPSVLPSTSPPPRWRMTVVSWLGIFPTVAFLLTFVAPVSAITLDDGVLVRLGGGRWASAAVPAARVGLERLVGAGDCG
jgi:antibiotic biosynthesis monooxygenase (ABM) superfamily enzyme